MRIGTRGSELALWQARRVRALLQQVAEVEAELVVIETAGDKDRTTALAEMTGKSFFTKEIEDALLDGRIDIAVHSLKDLQTVMPAGLALGAIPERADRSDMLVIRPESFDAGQPLRLKRGARVGTSSSRRIAQLHFLRPDLIVESLRGNVPTRVRKLRDGQYDAILLATAGLDRLALPLDEFRTYRLPESVMVPAPGQGALAVQIREVDASTAQAVARIDDRNAHDLVDLEREVLRHLDGGCQLALGTAAYKIANGIRLLAFFDPHGEKSPRRVVVNTRERDRLVPAVIDYLKVKRHSSNANGISVWITREPERAESFKVGLDANRFLVSALPTLRVVEDGDKSHQSAVLSDLSDYEWIMFTSQIAVREFARLVREAGVHIPKSTRLAAVGKKTAQAISEVGWPVAFVSDASDAASLATNFLAIHDAPIESVLFPCSASAGDGLESGLVSAVGRFERLECYDTIAHPELAPTVNGLPTPQSVVITSPQAARFLIEKRPLNPDTIAVSIGPSTSEALLILGCPIVYEAMDRSLEGAAEVINGLFPA